MCCGDRRASDEDGARATRMSSGVGNPLVVIQARLGSTRLPEKILAKIGDVPLIRHVWARANAIKGIADVVVAVPDLATKGAIVESGIPADKVLAFPQYDEDDVLSRFVWIARQWDSHQIFVRLTADNPFIDPKVAQDLLVDLVRDGAEYVSNLYDGYVDGSDVEVFSRSALERVHDDPRREHVTPAMGQPKVEADKKVRLTVDTEADLDFARKTYANLKDWADFSLAATLKAAKAAGEWTPAPASGGVDFGREAHRGPKE